MVAIKELVMLLLNRHIQRKITTAEKILFPDFKALIYIFLNL